MPVLFIGGNSRKYKEEIGNELNKKGKKAGVLSPAFTIYSSPIWSICDFTLNTLSAYSGSVAYPALWIPRMNASLLPW
jgi:hypothetical protein